VFPPRDPPQTLLEQLTAFPQRPRPSSWIFYGGGVDKGRSRKEMVGERTGKKTGIKRKGREGIGVSYGGGCFLALRGMDAPARAVELARSVSWLDGVKGTKTVVLVLC